MPDWKKEYRLSDLFRRGKPAAGAPAGASAPPVPPRPAASVEHVEAPHAAPSSPGDQPTVEEPALAAAAPAASGPQTHPVQPTSPQHGEEPGRPTAPDSPAGADQDAALKRQVRASDLFRRREKAPPVPADAFGGSSEPVKFWKKEIRLSDLLRRSPKEAAAVGAAAATAEAVTEADKAKAAKPFWKRELSLAGGSGSGSGKGARGAVPAPLAVPLMRSINLLPREEQGQKKQQRRLNLAHLGVAVAAAIVVGALGFGFIVERGRVQSRVETKQRLETAIVAAQQAASPSPSPTLEPVGEPELAAEQTARVTALSDALDKRYAWDRLLREVSVVLPGDTWLKGLVGAGSAPVLVNGATAPAAPGTVTLSGYSRSSEGVAKLLARLATLPDVADAQLLAATVVAIGEEDVVEFSIVATLRAGTEVTQ